MSIKLFLISLVFLFSSFSFAGEIPTEDLEAIYYAARDGRLRTIKMFVESKDYKNNKEKLEILLDVRGHTLGHTPLQLAVRNIDMKMAKYLLDNGADINSANFNKETALHFAAEIKDNPRGVGCKNGRTPFRKKPQD